MGSLALLITHLRLLLSRVASLKAQSWDHLCFHYIGYLSANNLTASVVSSTISFFLISVNVSLINELSSILLLVKLGFLC